ncbi:hypothetical protein D2V08_03400 [Flagellimonas lutimaris]|uniref:Uncharacterized protein n=1 Tax=Flagellimonas lutimaris TaxID=475082 RepID=A0A3A1NDR5_9FLAO|nr:hypothetical protein D2V08_03400 [Allomuricauda lutimaris]
MSKRHYQNTTTRKILRQLLKQIYIEGHPPTKLVENRTTYVIKNEIVNYLNFLKVSYDTKVATFVPQSINDATLRLENTNIHVKTIH